jgi:hypothetical protein
MNDHLILVANICYWVSGFLVGFGFRGLVYGRNRDKIVEEIILELSRSKELK